MPVNLTDLARPIETPPTPEGGTIWVAALVCLALGIGFGVLLPHLYRMWKKKGKVLILWVDPDGMGYKLSYEKRQGNEIAKPEGTYLLDGASRFTGKYSLWIVHYRHGYGLKVGSDSEPGNTQRPESDQELYSRLPGMRLLTVANPRGYFDAISRNEAADALNANKNEEPWFVKLMPLGIIALVLILGVVIFIAFKVKSA